MANHRIIPFLLIAFLAVSEGFIFPIFIKTIDLDSFTSKLKNPFFPTQVQQWQDVPAHPPSPAVRSWYPYSGVVPVPQQQRYVIPPTVQQPPHKEDVPVIVGQGHVF